MKTIRWMTIPATTALIIAAAIPAQSETVQITPGFKPDPQVVQGTSGGSKSTDCGFIATSPNQILKVKSALPYLRLNVQSKGQPTLLIDGPTGRFCVLADSSGGPKMAGYWAEGTYSVYVGDRGKGQNSYTLSITQTPD